MHNIMNESRLNAYIYDNKTVSPQPKNIPPRLLQQQCI